MNAVPTLDALTSRPELARELDGETLFSLILKAQSVTTVCAMAMVRTDYRPNRVLSYQEAAQRLGVSVRTLKRGRRTAYKTLVIQQGGKIGFNEEKVAQFIRARTGA